MPKWWEMKPGPERDAAKASQRESLPWAHREPTEVKIRGRTALRWKSVLYYFDDDATREVQRRLALAGQSPVANNLRCEIRGHRIVAIGRYSKQEYPVGELCERPALWHCFLAAAARQEYLITKGEP
jgi:hypothetical protein